MPVITDEKSVVTGFFVSKRQLVKTTRNMKKFSKRGQTHKSTWLVVAVDGKEDKI